MRKKTEIVKVNANLGIPGQRRGVSYTLPISQFINSEEGELACLAMRNSCGTWVKVDIAS